MTASVYTMMSVKSLHTPSLHLSCTTAFSSAAVRTSAACRGDKGDLAADLKLAMHAQVANTAQGKQDTQC